MLLEEWAARHGIGPVALVDLKAAVLGLDLPGSAPLSGMSEAAVSSRVRLEAVQAGVRLWRNNVGALLDKRGVPVRFGLANESKEQNARIKSGDLIGIRPIRVTPAHVGLVIGQFVSREIKAGDWKFNPNDAHEAAQLAWATLVRSLGGDACFANRGGTL